MRLWATALCFAAGCRTPDGGAALKDDQPVAASAPLPADPLARAACAAAEGELLAFSFVATAAQAVQPPFVVGNPGPLPPPPTDPFGSLWGTKPTKSVNVLFDTCFKDDLLKIKRIVFPTKKAFGQTPFTAGKQVVAVVDLVDGGAAAVTKKVSMTSAARIEHFTVPRAGAQISGFESAAFGDPAAFQLRIGLAADPPLRGGGKVVDGVAHMGVWRTKTAAVDHLDRDAAVTGVIENRLPFGLCPIGADEKSEVISKLGVKIEATYCFTSSIGGNSPAWHQDYVGLSITDASGDLPPAANETKTFGGSALAAVLRYETDNHHHFGDRVDVTLPHATYVWGDFSKHAELKAVAPACKDAQKCLAVKRGSGAWEHATLP